VATGDVAAPGAADLDKIDGSRLPAGRRISPGELLMVVQTCVADRSPAGYRDAALLAVLYAGLRRAEAVSLDPDDDDPETQTVRVIGKRNKERLVPLSVGGGDALTDWLAHPARPPRRSSSRSTGTAASASPV
jgi:site-specific recombinase XerD